jgi:hypothetical protein
MYNANEVPPSYDVLVFGGLLLVAVQAWAAGAHSATQREREQSEAGGEGLDHEAVIHAGFPCVIRRLAWTHGGARARPGSTA